LKENSEQIFKSFESQKNNQISSVNKKSFTKFKSNNNINNIIINSNSLENNKNDKNENNSINEIYEDVNNYDDDINKFNNSSEGVIQKEKLKKTNYSFAKKVILELQSIRIKIENNEFIENDILNNEGKMNINI